MAGFIWRFGNDEAVGCIGLRRLNVKNCEMKRLYVMPQYQRLGDRQTVGTKDYCRRQGNRLCGNAVGYLAFLTEALRMYKKIGFYKIESYNDSPLDNSIYMRLDL